MKTSPCLGHGLNVLVCLLTVAASGDDMNFARLVLAPAQPFSSALPLDDPNTDFVRPAESQSTHRAPEGNRLGATLADLRLSARPSWRQSLPPAPATGRPMPHAGLNSPLLC
jgi:hypothetical protein